MKRYRPNVCAVLTDDARAQVLVFRRKAPTIAEHSWQFPQGGLDEGEAPLDGLLRELKEEIGSSDVDLLAALPQPIRYDFPPEVRDWLAARDPEKSVYQGQEQSWFLLRLRGGTEVIHFDHQPAEFDAFRWVSPSEAVELVVPFKKEAYRAGLGELGLLPDGEV